MRAPILCPLLLAALCSCVHVMRSPGVLIATDPPGARVVVDGQDAGTVTPCHLDLGRREHRIDIELPGYETATRLVSKGGRNYLILWDEATVSKDTWPFPLFLNYEDGLFPIKREKRLSPSRIFVRLRISGEE